MLKAYQTCSTLDQNGRFFLAGVPVVLLPRVIPLIFHEVTSLLPNIPGIALKIPGSHVKHSLTSHVWTGLLVWVCLGGTMRGRVYAITWRWRSESALWTSITVILSIET